MQEILIVLEDQGGAVIHWNYDQLSPTIRAQTHDHLPIVVLDNGQENNINRKEVL